MNHLNDKGEELDNELQELNLQNNLSDIPSINQDDSID